MFALLLLWNHTLLSLSSRSQEFLLDGPLLSRVYKRLFFRHSAFFYVQICFWFGPLLSLMVSSKSRKYYEHVCMCVYITGKVFKTWPFDKTLIFNLILNVSFLFLRHPSFSLSYIFGKFPARIANTERSSLALTFFGVGHMFGNTCCFVHTGFKWPKVTVLFSDSIQCSISFWSKGGQMVWRGLFVFHKHIWSSLWCHSGVSCLKFQLVALSDIGNMLGLYGARFSYSNFSYFWK